MQGRGQAMLVFTRRIRDGPGREIDASRTSRRPILLCCLVWLRDCVARERRQSIRSCDGGVKSSAVLKYLGLPDKQTEGGTDEEKTPVEARTNDMPQPVRDLYDAGLIFFCSDGRC